MWMGIICLAAEVGVALAVKQWLEARKTLKGIDENSRKLHPPLTMAHAFYANMGGIAVLELHAHEETGEGTGAEAARLSNDTNQEITTAPTPAQNENRPASMMEDIDYVNDLEKKASSNDGVTSKWRISKYWVCNLGKKQS